MNLNYAIFRSEPIMTMSDLRQIGSHNNREKQAYNSNPDIKLELSKDNIELVPINTTYTKGFKEITKEYEKEHNERMKTERKERKRTFTEMLNKSRNVVADELLFTATHKFFDNMTREDIINWANTCMDFVYEDLGYKKEQVLHSVIHLDEETPHLHCVVIPLVKKLDKRTNTERYTISKKQYIKDKIHLSELQDKHHQRLTEKGYDLERGIKNSDTKHQKTKELKKTTRYYENKVKNINKKLDFVMNEFDEKMKITKKVPFSKTQLLIEKDTFDSMNKVINETKKVIELEPKIQELFSEVNHYTKSHQTLEKENQSMQREIKSLKTRNHNLTEENNNLKSYISTILEAIKRFFRKILLFGNDKSKSDSTREIIEYYDNKDFNSDDVYDISRSTDKEDELFDYANIPSYMKSNKNTYNEKDKDDFELEK